MKKTVTRISASDAANHLGDLLGRVEFGGERFIVMRYRRPVCEIIPIERQLQTIGDDEHASGDDAAK